MRDEMLFIEDIVNASDAIQRFLVDVDQDKFWADEILQGAVMHRLIIIGEAASQLSKEFRNSHTEINWKGIIAFRNILVHVYFGLDMDIVWTTAKNQAGTLGGQLRRYLE